MSLCRFHSAQYVAVSLILRFDSLLLSLHSYRIALSELHIRVTAVLAPALFLSAADPHASGRTTFISRYALTATLTSDYHCRFCRVCFVLSVDYRPSYFGSDNLLRSLHAHRIALLALIPLARWLLTHVSFRQPPVGSIRSTCPFCVHSRSLSRYASLMLRSSTPSFTSFTQPSFLMAIASFHSSGVCTQ
jgi:hypothetical protein